MPLQQLPHSPLSKLLGSIGKSATSRWREVILPICLAVVRPHLVYCAQTWASQNKEDVDIPQLATKMASGVWTV